MNTNALNRLCNKLLPEERAALADAAAARGDESEVARFRVPARSLAEMTTDERRAIILELVAIWRARLAESVTASASGQ